MMNIGIGLLVMGFAVSSSILVASERTERHDVLPVPIQIIGDAVRVDEADQQLCLKKQEDFYCGRSHSVSYLAEDGKIARAPLTAVVDRWQIGSLYVDGKVLFVVVDDQRGTLWTLPDTLERTVGTLSVRKNDIVTLVDLPDPLADRSVGCNCIGYDRFFPAAAIISTF
ncbi:MAG: hypothetical protein H6998_00655 [Hahellaceae bacterium]|nr:hypothetical protein [Hahellaceae bacterium]